MANEVSRRVLRTNLELPRAVLGNMKPFFQYIILFVMPILLSIVSCNAQSIETDIEGLMAFKVGADLGHVLKQSWTGNSPCGSKNRGAWLGIRCNNRGRVASVNLSNLQLSGSFPEKSLSRLNELRYLAVSNNTFTGSIPDDMSNVTGLLQLWAQNAHLSGAFPKLVTSSKRLVKVNLFGNKLTGPIPDLTSLPVLILLNLRNNMFTGDIPPLPSSLLTLDLSLNSLSGNISSVLAQKFPNSSFTGNEGLCGPPLSNPCLSGLISTPASSPPPARAVTLDEPAISNFKGTSLPPTTVNTKKHPARLKTKIIAILVVAYVLMLVIVTLILYRKCWRRGRKDVGGKSNKVSNHLSAQITLASIPETERSKLVFFEDSQHRFELEDLLRATAEMLGKGSFGIAYKALLDSGNTVAVKRLREVRVMGKKEFDLHMEMLGRLRHPNLVPLRGFYFSGDEKLLVYDFMPNGSLFSLLHGNRGPGRTPCRTPLGWTSRLQIAQSIAIGLTYLHHECEFQKIPHGNLKSSNILVGKNLEICITDFGLAPLMTPTMAAERLAGYRAPEFIYRRKISHKADVYSFGVLLLELLTGRHSAQSSQGDDLPNWVHSMVREEWTGEVFDLELKSYRQQEEEMVTLLQIAMGCVAPNPDQRPKMADLAKLIEEISPGIHLGHCKSFDSTIDLCMSDPYDSYEAPLSLR